MSTHMRAWLGAMMVSVLLATLAVSAEDLAQYRDFRLGTSTAVVMKAAQAEVRDLRTLHQRPSVLMELAWRPPYRPGEGGEWESVRDVLFSFVDDQLFRMLVTYDRSRTEGLTPADMVAALSATYGRAEQGRSLPSGTAGAVALDSATAVARWRSDTATVVLRHYDYGGGYSLLLTSVALEPKARAALARAVALDQLEAPAREAARLKSQAEAARQEAEQTRSRNREAFTP